MRYPAEFYLDLQSTLVTYPQIRRQRERLLDAPSSLRWAENVQSLDRSIVAFGRLMQTTNIELGESLVTDYASEAQGLRNLVFRGSVPPGAIDDFPEGGEIALKFTSDTWSTGEYAFLQLCANAELPFVKPAFLLRHDLYGEEVRIVATRLECDAMSLNNVLAPDRDPLLAAASGIVRLLKPLHESELRIEGASRLWNDAAVQHYERLANAIWLIGDYPTARFLQHLERELQDDERDGLLHYDAFPQNVLIPTVAWEQLEPRRPWEITDLIETKGVLLDPASKGKVGRPELDAGVVGLGMALLRAKNKAEMFVRGRSDPQFVKDLVTHMTNADSTLDPSRTALFLGTFMVDRAVTRLADAMVRSQGSDEAAKELLSDSPTTNRRSSLYDGRLGDAVVQDPTAATLLDEGAALLLHATTALPAPARFL